MIDATVTVDRSSLGLADLTISCDSETYVIQRDGFSLPGTTWRRTEATSEFLHGGLLTAATKATSTYEMTVEVHGATAAACRANARALIRAFEQFPSYPMTLTIDGESETWRAYVADSTPGGPLMLDMETSDFVWEVALTVPVYPIPGS